MSPCLDCGKVPREFRVMCVPCIRKHDDIIRQRDILAAAIREGIKDPGDWIDEDGWVDHVEQLRTALREAGMEEVTDGKAKA